MFPEASRAARLLGNVSVSLKRQTSDCGLMGWRGRRGVFLEHVNPRTKIETAVCLRFVTETRNSLMDEAEMSQMSGLTDVAC